MVQLVDVKYQIKKQQEKLGQLTHMLTDGSADLLHITQLQHGMVTTKIKNL